MDKIKVDEAVVSSKQDNINIDTAAPVVEVVENDKIDVMVQPENYILASAGYSGGVPSWVSTAISEMVRESTGTGGTLEDALNKIRTDLMDQIELGVNQAIAEIENDYVSNASLTTTLASEIGASKASILNDIQTYSDATQAVASDVNALKSSFGNDLSADAITAFIGNVALTKATDKEVFAQTVDTLTASYNGISAKIESTEGVVAGQFTEWKGATTPKLGMYKIQEGSYWNYVGGTLGENGDGWIRTDKSALDAAKEVRLNLTDDLGLLKTQVDGLQETLTGTYSIVDDSDAPDKLAEPYKTWLAADTTNNNTNMRLAHTADVYIKYSLDSKGIRVYSDSYRFVQTVVGTNTDSDGFTWAKITDQATIDTLNTALQAKDLADKKRTTYYLDKIPEVGDTVNGYTITDGDICDGDLWVPESDTETVLTLDGTEYRVGEVYRYSDTSEAWTTLTSYTTAAKLNSGLDTIDLSKQNNDLGWTAALHAQVIDNYVGTPSLGDYWLDNTNGISSAVLKRYEVIDIDNSINGFVNVDTSPGMQVISEEGQSYSYNGSSWINIIDKKVQEDMILAVGSIQDLEATDDKEVVIFYQTTVPAASDMSYGDYWLDTDSNTDGNYDYTVYRYEDSNGENSLIRDYSNVAGYVANSWVDKTGSFVADKILKAYIAEKKADSAASDAATKIKSYYSDTEPTLADNPDLTEGYIWVDTSDNDSHMYRYNDVGEWVRVISSPKLTGIIDDFEYKDDASILDNWKQVGGSGTTIQKSSTVHYNGSSSMEIGVADSSNGGATWLVYDHFITFKPNTLYKISCRAKCTAQNDGKAYIGVVGYNKDKTLHISQTGLESTSYGGSHYIAASNQQLTTDFTEYVGYFRGTSTTDVSSSTSSIAEPTTLYDGIAFIKPIIIANYTGTVGSMYFDDFMLEEVDKLVLDNFINTTYNPELLNIRNQVDGVAVTYFQDGIPYESPEGAIENSGDVWYNTSTDTAAKFIYKQTNSAGVENIMKSAYTTFEEINSTILYTGGNTNINPTLVTDPNLVKEGKYGLELTAGAVDSYVYFGSNTTDYNVPVPLNSTIIVSAYVKVLSGDGRLELFTRRNGSGVHTKTNTQVNGTGWTRIQHVVSTGASSSAILVRIDNNTSTIVVSGIMVEVASTGQTVASEFVNTSMWQKIDNGTILTALKSASDSKAAADRSINNYTGTSTPAHPFFVGDTWMKGETGDVYVCNADSISTETDAERAGKWVVASKSNLNYRGDVPPANPKEGDTWAVTAPSIRYIRDHLSGNNENSYNLWVEIQAINNAGDNVALGKGVSHNGGAYSTPSVVTDGSFDNPSRYYNAKTGIDNITIDLGGTFNDIAELKIWHYYNGTRIYNGTKTEISADGINWVTVFDSAIDGTYLETSEGHSVLPISSLGEILIYENGQWVLSNNYSENLNDFINVVDDKTTSLQNQIDHKIEYYFQKSTDATPYDVTGFPKGSFTSDTRTLHDGDVIHFTDTSETYRYHALSDEWKQVQDADALKAINLLNAEVTKFYGTSAERNAETTMQEGDQWLQDTGELYIYTFKGTWAPYSSRVGTLYNANLGNPPANPQINDVWVVDDRYYTKNTTNKSEITATRPATDVMKAVKVHDGTSWVVLDYDDKEAFKNISWQGHASKLLTAPDGSVTGWEFSDGSDQQSEFKINADKFYISNGDKSAKVPFSIDSSTSTTKIKFDGIVDFTNSNTSEFENYVNIVENDDWKYELENVSKGSSDDALSAANTIQYIPAGSDWAPKDRGIIFVRQYLPLNVSDTIYLYLHKMDGAWNEGWPVTPGARYAASCYVGAHRCDAYLVLVFRDNTATNTWITPIDEQISNTNHRNRGAFKENSATLLSCVGTAPSNATSVELMIFKGDTYINDTSSYIFIHKPMLAKVSSDTKFDKNNPIPYTPHIEGAEDWINYDRTRINGSKITTGNIKSNVKATSGDTTKSITEMDLDNGIFKIFDNTGTLRVQLGDLSQ